METVERGEALEFLRVAPVAHVGVVWEGEPYVTPLSFVLSDEALFFRIKEGRKLEAIRENPVVSVEASDFDPETGHWISVVVKGRATEVGDDAVETETMSRLFSKYQEALGSLLGHGRPEPLAGEPRVIRVDIEDMTGMRSGHGLSPRARPGWL